MPKETPFQEAPVWSGVQGEWRPVFGNFHRKGVSVEWHDFECDKAFDWSQSFHPDSLEICVNFTGCGTIHESRARTTVINPQTVAQYVTSSETLRADRHAGQRHSFLTLELSRPWLEAAVRGSEQTLNRETRAFLDGDSKGRRTREFPMHQRVRASAEEMLQPPLQGLGLSLWFQAKILEITALTLTEPEADLFCQRHKRVALDRVEQVKALLAQDFENPPTLAQLGRQVGCSPFYLSRMFSENTGLTISRYLRKIRLEHAAELLRSGKCNVTEAAMTVGYSSLSHFSKAFAEMFGACPCVFPLKK